LGDPNGIATTLGALARLTLHLGHYREAEQLVQESVQILRQTKNRNEIGHAINNLGLIFLGAGKFHDSQSALEKNIELWRDLGGYRGETVSRSILSQVVLHLGDYKQATAYAKSCLDMAQRSNDQSGIGHALVSLAMVALVQKKYCEAQMTLEKCIALWQDHGYHLLRGHAFALAGFAAWGMDNPSLSQQYLSNALDISVEYSLTFPLIYTLAGFALLHIAEGQSALAIEIYALVSNNPHLANSCWFADAVGKRIADIASTLAPEVVAEAKELGRGRHFWEYVAEKRFL
ncbi:tetratricopeptide repeat protein, partial [Chloroflexi bacterium TSY]|nr:tetratricopeptide repeat protein [Chloroflexi bacterium TSY]